MTAAGQSGLAVPPFNTETGKTRTVGLDGEGGGFADVMGSPSRAASVVVGYIGSPGIPSRISAHTLVFRGHGTQ